MYATQNTVIITLIAVISFVTYDVTAVRKLTIPSRNTHPACKRNDILHSDVVEDRGLKTGVSPTNYTMLGLVPTMADCMALCCSAKHCNIAYMRNDTCYAVSCNEPEHCQVHNTTRDEDSGTKLALIIRNEMNRRVYVTAYLVVVVCAFGAAMSGTVWAIFIFYKRYTVISGGSGGEKQPQDAVSDATGGEKRMHY